MAVHHSLMGSTRPILISPQGFPVTANHQFFNERIFSPSAIAPVLSSGLNDAPLEFNVLRQKTSELHIYCFNIQIFLVC